MSNIDWSRPLEAYHEDGRVLSVAIDFSDDRSCIFTKEELGGGQRWFRPNGDAINDAHGWRIRNKAEPKADIPEWAMKKAATLAGYQGILDDLSATALMGFGSDMQVAFARYIANHEEPPVDPDLIEARQIEYEICKAQNMYDPEQALRGEWDEKEGLKGVLRAIKRGRELERGEVK